jgi:hypothetical protein
MWFFVLGLILIEIYEKQAKLNCLDSPKLLRSKTKTEILRSLSQNLSYILIITKVSWQYRNGFL